MQGVEEKDSTFSWKEQQNPISNGVCILDWEEFLGTFCNLLHKVLESVEHTVWCEKLRSHKVHNILIHLTMMY